MFTPDNISISKIKFITNNFLLYEKSLLLFGILIISKNLLLNDYHFLMWNNIL
jgi:hypothetical protein